MKANRTICLFTLAIIATVSKAATIDVDGIQYYYDSETNEASVISGRNPEMPDTLILPDAIEIGDRTYAVTAISRSAFWMVTELKCLIIGNAVREIQEGAFKDCTNLTAIVFPASLKSIAKRALEGCTNLKQIGFASIESMCCMDFGEEWKDEWGTALYIGGVEVVDLVIPEGLTDIGKNAFRGFSCLKSVKVPSSMKTIADNAFQGCTGLERAEFASIESLCSIKYGDNPLRYAHNLYIDGKEIKDLIIPDGVEDVPSHAFQGSNITSVTMSDDVKSTGYLSFSDCPYLKTVKFGKGIESIGIGFSECPLLDHVEFADINCLLRMSFDGQSSNTIGNPLYYARHLFSDGEEVKEITFPEGLKEIGECVLMNCESVERIHIPEDVEKIHPKAFANCKNLVSIDLPSTLQYILSSAYGAGGSAFDFCESLEEIRVNGNNTSYDSRDNCNAAIFTPYNCLMIGGNKTTIPSSIVEINACAFYGRTKLTSIHIPSSVVMFGGYSFGECSSLKDFYYDAHAMPQMANTVFRNTPIGNATLHVPEDMIETFRKTAPWSGFGQIVALQPGDMPDGIEEVPSPLATSPRVGTAIYDLQGRKVEKPEKGIYIVNGRKVMIK